MSEYLERLSAEDFYSVFGIRQDQFEDMFSSVDGFKDPSGQKFSQTCLQLFLLNMRQGLSLTYLKDLYNFESKGAVGTRIKAARLALLDRFMPRHLGPQAQSREEAIRHVTELARIHHAPEGNQNNIVLTINGTYLYIPKYFNFKELKKTYCFHKGRHLIKMNMCVLPDGYILDCHGPYYSDSSNNDAAILMNDLRQNLNGLRDFLQEGDVIVVDRGYRDFLSRRNSDLRRICQDSCKGVSANTAHVTRMIPGLLLKQDGSLKSATAT